MSRLFFLFPFNIIKESPLEMNKNAWPCLYKICNKPFPIESPLPIPPPLDNWWDFLHFLCQICQPFVNLFRSLHDSHQFVCLSWYPVLMSRKYPGILINEHAVLFRSSYPPPSFQGFISISYQFISGHLHYQRFSCPLIKMSNPILFDKWKKCKLGWTTHGLWENCLPVKNSYSCTMQNGIE